MRTPLLRAAVSALLSIAFALAAPLGASAQTLVKVTTTVYSASSLSEDIALSCKLGHISTGTTIKFNCNAEIDGTRVVTTTTQNIDSYVACLQSTAGVLSLAWSTANDPTGVTFEDLSVTLDSTGDDYLLEADCTSTVTGVNTLNDARLDLSDTTSGFKNSGGGLVKR